MGKISRRGCKKSYNIKLFKEKDINTSIDNILFSQEKSGLKFQNILRIGAGILYILASLFLGTGTYLETVVTPFVMIFYILLAAVMIYFLPKSNRILLFNLIGILLDVVLLAAISAMLYEVMNPEVTPFSFILKSDIFPISILFLLFHMISFLPRVIFISGAVLLFFNLTLLYLSLVISPHGVTADFSEAFTSYKVNIDFEMGKIFTFVFIAATIYFINRRMRKTLYASAAAEVASVQLRRYFSPDIADKIISNKSEILELGGSEHYAAILFSDIENFTALSESLEPQEVLNFLSQYHEKMLKVIFENHGSLDKFIGDAIMATFGVPHPLQNDAMNAVNTALAMNEALDELNSDRQQRGEFCIKHRIGIHYGKVLAGNIGSRQQLEYTVIGDTVNTANRIEQACKQFKKTILLSHDVVLKAGDSFRFEPLGDVEVKGKNKPISVYTVSRDLSLLEYD